MRSPSKNRRAIARDVTMRALSRGKSWLGVGVVGTREIAYTATINEILRDITLLCVSVGQIGGACTI